MKEIEFCESWELGWLKSLGDRKEEDDDLYEEFIITIKSYK